MKNPHYKLESYAITSDHHLLDEQNHINLEVRQIIENIHPDVLKGRKYLLKKLPRLIQQFPKVPVFKNLLASVHKERGETKQAFKANRWLVKEHPDYLYGKLNLAAEYLDTEELEKIPEILGELLELKALYPQRETFHIEEFIAFNQIAALYFLSQDNLEQAEIRIDMMKEVDAEHFKTQDVEEKLRYYIFMKAAERRQTEMESYHEPIIKDRRSQLQTTTTPKFNFPLQIQWLYEEDYDFPVSKLETILNLERQPLIEDLEKVLQDSIARYDYFMEAEDYNFLEFAMHAIFLLCELKAYDSLESILELFKQDDDFLESWFGDFINDIAKSIVLNLGEKNLPELFQFLRLPNLYPFSKAYISEGLFSLATEQPYLEEKITKFYKETLRFYIEKGEDPNFADSVANGLIISDITNNGYKDLLPEVQQLFKLGLVAKDICGTWEDVGDSIQHPRENLIFNTAFAKASIFEKYAIWKENYETYLKKEFEDASQEDNVLSFFDEDIPFDEEAFRGISMNNEHQPYVKIKEPGRNDPCPCGSGKKYKKCCMN